MGTAHRTVEAPRLSLMSASRPERQLEVVRPHEEDTSFASVYRAHVDFVRRSVRHLGARPSAVDDIVHDVFLVVHRRLRDRSGTGSMKSWLFGIARRVVMHHHRHGVRQQRREAAAPVPGPVQDPEHVVATREAARWVDRFLAQLDGDQRVVFVLADVEGMTAPEIAAATGAAVNTVYSRLRLAREKFERALRARKGKEGGPG